MELIYTDILNKELTTPQGELLATDGEMKRLSDKLKLGVVDGDLRTTRDDVKVEDIFMGGEKARNPMFEYVPRQGRSYNWLPGLGRAPI